MTQPSEICRFLGEWFRDAERGWLQLNHDTGGKLCTEWFEPGDFTEMARVASGLAPATGIWMPIATRRERVARRGTANDCLDVVAFSVDIDVAGEVHPNKNYPTTIKEAVSMAGDFALAPTVIVMTGHGVQAHWLLDEPVEATQAAEVLRRFAVTMQVLANRRGHTVDDVGTVERMFRLPGTLNTKRSPVEAVIIEANYSRRYGLDDLDEITIPQPTPIRPPRAITTGIPIGSPKPGAWYNDNHGVAENLERAGCAYAYTDRADGRPHYYAPHHAEAKGVTGITIYADADGEHAVIWSAGFAEVLGVEPRSSLDAFGLFARLQHGGNFIAAAAAAAAERDGPPESSAAAELPLSWSDAHVGESFGRSLEGRWLFCRALKGWHRWDGKRWALDPGEAVHEEFRQWIIALGDRVWHASGSEAVMTKIAKYRERGKIDAAVTIARRLTTIAASAGEFDQHPHLLNVDNGVIDLRTGALGPHDPALRLRQIAGAAYLPGAVHDDVVSVLAAMDPDVRAWVQRFFGSAAYGAVVDDVLAVFDGSGSNGKTTLLVSVAAALGEYATAIPGKLLIARGANEEHPTLIANLVGRRLIYIEETPEGGALKMEQVKAITGGGELSARFIGRDYFTFTPTHQLVVATNHRPAVNASDYAAWRRLRLVPFPRTYRLPHEATGGQLVADRGLRGRLGRPQQREAMLAWIVAGAVAWHHDGGLGGCEAIDRLTASWRSEEDVIHGFWNDCLMAGDSIPAGILYREFQAWCHHQGRKYVPTNTEFVKRFTGHELYDRHNVRKANTAGGALYYGVSTQVVVGVVALPVRF